MQQQTTAKQALAEAYTAMQPTLIAIFRQAGLPLQDCEDMTQDTFLKVMAIDMLRQETLQSIIVTTAYSLRTDYLRHRAVIKRHRQHLRHAFSANRFDYADSQFMAREISQVELTAITRMSPQNKNIYALSRFSDLTCDEIAQAVSMTYRAVESRLYRARQEVRRAVALAI